MFHLYILISRHNLLDTFVITKESDVSFFIELAGMFVGFSLKSPTFFVAAVLTLSPISLPSGSSPIDLSFSVYKTVCVSESLAV